MQYIPTCIKIREFLGLHSPEHAELFREEALAAESAQRHWRKRILSPNYYKSYIAAQVYILFPKWVGGLCLHACY
jgi:hypothetical protein